MNIIRLVKDKLSSSYEYDMSMYEINVTSASSVFFGFQGDEVIVFANNLV